MSGPEPISRINQFRAAVVSTIAAAMPKLRHCEEQFGRFDLDELERTVMGSPAVRVAVLQARCPAEAHGKLASDLSCAAFIITSGADRDRKAWTIAEAIASMLHTGQLWGLTKLGAPTSCQVQPVITGALKNRAVALIAVEWKQQLRDLAATLWDESGAVIEGVYLNDEEVEGDSADEGGESGGDDVQS